MPQTDFSEDFSEDIVIVKSDAFRPIFFDSCHLQYLNGTYRLSLFFENGERILESGETPREAPKVLVHEAELIMPPEVFFALWAKGAALAKEKDDEKG